MEFFDVVTRRRSVRKFTAESMPVEIINRALDAALLAPNSSNMQAWEFYWVKSPAKKTALVQACFGQGAARTAAELIVAVSTVATWRRNRDLILQGMGRSGPLPPAVTKYYNTVVPLSYWQDPLGLLGVLKTIVFSVVGLFRPVPRGPAFRYQLFEVVTKSTALACENLMLALAAQGYDSCPMEGFDERRVKKLLGLGAKSHVVMVIGTGRADSGGLFGERFRVDRPLVVKEI